MSGAGVGSPDDDDDDVDQMVAQALTLTDNKSMTLASIMDESDDDLSDVELDAVCFSPPPSLLLPLSLSLSLSLSLLPSLALISHPFHLGLATIIGATRWTALCCSASSFFRFFPRHDIHLSPSVFVRTFVG
jgi:hypothetical protein